MKKIFITVDVECHDPSDANRYIWGKINGKPYGLEKILELGEKLSLPFNFFVDIAEAFRYGDEFVLDIIRKIQEKGQPVFLHLHPNYVTGDENRSYFWQYHKEEKARIFMQVYTKYQELVGDTKPLIFRMGRYGVDEEFYDFLQKNGFSIIDLSYIYESHKMCHLSYSECKAINAPVWYKGQLLLPNTSYVGFDMWGRKKLFTIDVAQTCRAELFDVIKATKSPYIVMTMHVWDFFDRYFFTSQITPKNRVIKKLELWIKTLRSQDFEFKRLDEVEFDMESMPDDEVYEPFKGRWNSKVKYIWYNFIRFQGIAKKTKKYFLFFAAMYIGVFFAAAMVLKWMI